MDGNPASRTVRSVEGGPITAVLFDKDGTLIDFHRTWDAAVGQALREAAPSVEVMHRAAELLDFDLGSNSIRPGSVIVAESNDVITTLLEPILDASRWLEIVLTSAMTMVTAAAGVPDALHELRACEISLGVVTNDDANVAARQLEILGWRDLFAQVVGADSGFGAKPEPGMITGVLALLGVEPSNAIVVGDSGHDLEAGRRAGVTTVLVTNGVSNESLAAMADITIESVAELLSRLRQERLLGGNG